MLAKPSSMARQEKRKMDVRTEFGKNIRRLRREKKITQEGLGELTGLHRTYIGLVERGEKSISLVNAMKIANALGVAIGACVPENDRQG